MALEIVVDEAARYARERARRDPFHPARMAVRRENLVKALDWLCALRHRTSKP